MNLARFPRVTLCQLPTPLERLGNLTKTLGGPTIYIKRDDCTGLAIGGNKSRKLEFLVADALEKGADTLITQGGSQSNHARQTAAAAAKLGLRCHLVLERRLLSPSEEYETSGNVLLNGLFGAEVTYVSNQADSQDVALELATRIANEGAKPYLIPGGGSNAIGALGYVACVQELMEQCSEQNVRPSHLVHATNSSGTQAGLLIGVDNARAPVDIIGVSVRYDKATQENSILRLARTTEKHLGRTPRLSKHRICVTDAFIGEGYGLPTEATIAAIKLVAQHEGILLDPVYTGKAMAGLIAMIQDGRFSKSDNIVFLHTGGTPALFAYRKHLTPS